MAIRRRRRVTASPAPRAAAARAAPSITRAHKITHATARDTNTLQKAINSEQDDDEGDAARTRDDELSRALADVRDWPDDQVARRSSSIRFWANSKSAGRSCATLIACSNARIASTGRLCFAKNCPKKR